MTRKIGPIVIGLAAFTASTAADWRQFRGNNAAGISTDTDIVEEFGPETNVVWSTPVPAGHSSPSITEDRIFLTAFEKDKLFTMALDRGTGKILWRREAPRPRQQQIDRPANSPTSASPVSDGRNVYVFFQDFGLLAYGPDGNELWRVPLGPFNNPFGHGSSPILADGKLLMQCDQDTNSFLLALDPKTGRTVWRTERPHAQRGYATPVLYQPQAGPLQVIAAGSFRLSGYDVKTGKELWWVRRLPWQVKPTPIVAGDAVYFVTFSAESEPGEQENVPTFDDALATLDANKDGKLSKSEIVDQRAKARFDEYLDLDHTGFLEKRDWDQFRERRQGESALRAYRLGGQGDLTDTNFIWKHSKSLPNVPSPLSYRDVLYTLKEGGIFTSFNQTTGAVLKQSRIPGAIAEYYASPVAADGKIYTVSEDGKAAVIRAGGQWELLRVNDLKDGCKATPAIVDGKLYIRTYSTMYCFDKPRKRS